MPISFKGYYQLPVDPKLVGWFDASQVNGIGSALPSNASSLVTWYDLSGLYENPQQNTLVNQPTFYTNIANGLPGVYFSSAPVGGVGTANGDWLRYGPPVGSFNMSSANAFTMFIVAQIDALTAPSGSAGCMVFNHGSGVGTNQQYQITQTLSGGTIQCSAQSSSDGAVRSCNPGTVSINTPFTVSFYTNSASYGSSSGLKARLNTNAIVNADGSYAGVSGGAGADGFNLGEQKNAQNTRRFDGYIFEYLLYARELSSSERLTVQQYLSRKWGTPYPNS